MGSFTYTQDLFVSNSQSKKFALIKKSCVPRAHRFSCQAPPAKGSEQGYGDENVKLPVGS